MKYESIFSAQLKGIEGETIRVETDISRGLHAFSIVGLGDTAIRESKDRISAAIKNSGFTSPKQKNQKVTIALAPAHIKKEGTSFDLAMALCYLAASGNIPPLPTNIAAIGELTLEGAIESVRGVAVLVDALKLHGVTRCLVPHDSYSEAQLIEGIECIPCAHLSEAVEYIQTNTVPKHTPSDDISYIDDSSQRRYIFDTIREQEHVKRALILAAIGHHNIILYGPPGTGKTSLALSFKSILPRLSKSEALETFKIHSSIRNDAVFTLQPPFRAPHHTSSYASIIGGGTPLRPGEITLAHNGVLFLDECAEFDRRVLESLRQPMEEHCIRIHRGHDAMRLPAQAIIIAALNPCPCGYYGSPHKSCSCIHTERDRYRRKFSGPLIDRFDICSEVANTPQNNTLLLHHDTDNSNTDQHSLCITTDMARDIVEKALIFRSKRIKDQTGFVSEDAQETIHRLRHEHNLSLRNIQRIMNLARTIADTGESMSVKSHHVFEAYQYWGKRSFI